jgi:hypothetical protein
MSTSRLPFIDWMKCLGMLVIVYGHTAGTYVSHATDPFNPKQLGVAFFVFVTGFSLARETRPAWRVVCNRLFDVYLFGLAFALLLSVIQLFRISDLNESNYLPFLLGANVLFDNFPANPTTWYIGTYLHVLLVWWLIFRGRRLPLWVVGLVVVCEILVRAWLVHNVGNFVAYMALSNWLGVFVLGTWAGQNYRDAAEWRVPRLSLSVVVGGLLLFWPLFIHQFPVGEGFPFQRIDVGGGSADLLATSASVTFLYLGCTWLVFEVTRQLGDAAMIRFFARNTLIIFIVHMPLLYGLSPELYRWIGPGWTRVVFNLMFYYVLLAVVSEAICRIVQPKRLREAFLARVRELFHHTDRVAIIVNGDT